MFLGIFTINYNTTNSKEELEQICTHYYLDIYKYCLQKMEVDQSSIDDVTEEVFKLLCQKWDILDSKNIRAWLYRTADNLIKNFYKKYKKNSEKISSISNLEESLFYEEDYNLTGNIDIDECKDQIINNLSVDEKELFYMNYIEKLSHSEIRAKLNISEDALKKRLYRLKQKITEEVYKKIRELEYK